MKIRIRYASLLVFLFILTFIILRFSIDSRPGTDGSIIGSIETNRYKGATGNQIAPNLLRAIDSLKNVQQNQKFQLVGIGDGISAGSLGFVHLKECDTCTSTNYYLRQALQVDKYFLYLKGYRLKQNNEFYIKDGKYYLVEEFIESESNDPRSGIIHQQTKEIPIRYRTNYSTNTPSNTKVDRGILIPLPPDKVMISKILLYGAMFIFLYFLLMITIIFPGSVILEIARGRPFTLSNCKKLTIMGWFSILIAMGGPLLIKFIGILYHNLIPSGFYYPLAEAIYENIDYMLAGTIILLIAEAFKSGQKLKEEQDLTV